MARYVKVATAGGGSASCTLSGSGADIYDVPGAWTPIWVCQCWKTAISGKICIPVNFSCYEMVKFQMVHGNACYCCAYSNPIICYMAMSDKTAALTYGMGGCCHQWFVNTYSGGCTYYNCLVPQYQCSWYPSLYTPGNYATQNLEICFYPGVSDPCYSGTNPFVGMSSFVTCTQCGANGWRQDWMAYPYYQMNGSCGGCSVWPNTPTAFNCLSSCDIKYIVMCNSMQCWSPCASYGGGPILIPNACIAVWGIPKNRTTLSTRFCC